MQWVMSGTQRVGLSQSNLAELNIPTLEQAIEIYCKATGRAGIPDLNWYFAYNLFRLTGILQGIAGRIRDGTAASARAHESAARVKPLALASWEYAMKAGAK
jgi:aminoglycoside phosphotransferase (APT) family kinase protein